MKSYILFSLIPAFLLLTAGACSKHKNREKMPAVVVENFDKDNKEAGTVHWEPEGKNYKATYEEDDVEKVALYSPKGKKIRVEIRVKEQEVPEVVITRLRKKYPQMQLQEVVLVERPERKPVYLVKVKDDKAITRVEINPVGVILKTLVLESFVVKVQPAHYEREHGHCDRDHHKHKHKHKYKHDDHHEGHGNCKNDHHDQYEGHEIVRIEVKN
jgi:hypothetical protein